ncbi:MAG: hypothetical protein IJN20_03760 [Oscillospiraceae bacterium]|nr:hypothetical protein [Oscillospiraceae bacterium]
MGDITTVDLITIAFSVIAAVFSLITYRNSIIHDRKQATLDAYNQLQEQALDHLNLYRPSNIKEIVKDRRSEEYKRLSAYVARIEHFCVGVNQKIYDQKTVYELAHGYFDGGLKVRIEPVIDGKNRFGEDYYANIHTVYAWMEAETEKREKYREE